MQYYTKQQLQGAGKYSSPCRNGNWNEDDVNDEVGTLSYSIMFFKLMIPHVVERVEHDRLCGANPER